MPSFSLHQLKRQGHHGPTVSRQIVLLTLSKRPVNFIRIIEDNVVLSTVVALSGVGAPSRLCVLLRYSASATSLQCFAGGAALCSTSFATAFTLYVLWVTATRLGMVMTNAAMIDDVASLVMAQVVSSLSSSDSTFDGPAAFISS